jgi:hypothetical protein
VILAQIWGMVRYELRMQWRRRGLLVFIAVLCAAVFLLGIAIRYWDSEDEPVPISERVPDPALARRIEQMQATVAALIGVVAPVFMFLIMGLAIVVADVVPRDRDLAVRELLDSLPWGYGVYLVGKLLSVWGGVLGGMIVVAALALLMGRVFLGPQHVLAHLAVWGCGLLPLALYVSGMGTLLAAAQPTRRRGVFVGVAFSVYCVAMLLTTSFTLWDAVSPARPSSLFALQQAYLEQAVAEAQTLDSFSYGDPFGRLSAVNIGLAERFPRCLVPLTIAGGALQVALAWLVVWLWMQWKERVQ